MPASDTSKPGPPSPVGRPCPVCEGHGRDILHAQAFVLPEGHPLGDGYEVACCQACGFVFADTAADQKAYDAFYAKLSKYEDNTTVTGAGVTPWDLKRLQDAAAGIARFLPDKSARVVDVGCANGGLLNALKGLGYENLCGVDPSPGCVAYVRDHLGIEAYAGVLDPLPGDVKAADAVILSHVLEHVREIRPALAAVREVMKPGGILYVEVPDATRYTDFVFSPFQDFNTEHINHFSESILAQFLESCGFRPKASGRGLSESGPGMPYPITFVFGIKDGTGGSTPWNFVKDETLRPTIEDYIRKSSDLLEAIDDKIRRALEGSGPILVYGAGQLAMKLLAETTLSKADIVAFVDGNPINHGKIIKGVPVLAPEEVGGMTHPILITSTLHEREIAQRIAELGLPNRVLTLGSPG